MPIDVTQRDNFIPTGSIQKHYKCLCTMQRHFFYINKRDTFRLLAFGISLSYFVLVLYMSQINSRTPMPMNMNIVRIQGFLTFMRVMKAIAMMNIAPP